MRTQGSAPRAALGAVVAAIVAVWLSGCGSPPPPPVATVVIDRTPSSVEFLPSMRAGAITYIEMAIRDGDVTELAIVGVGGGPRDAVTVTVDLGCEGTDRQCADAARVERLVTEAVAALDRVLATPTTVSGSSPISATWTVLSSAQRGDHVLVISDYVEHSDVYDLVDSVDLSTTDARADVIDHIAMAGPMNFAELELEGVIASVALVPAEIGGASAVRFEHMRLFAEELLGVDVAPLALTVAAG